MTTIIENTLVYKERKAEEDIELSNVRNYKPRSESTEEWMIWVEKDGTFDKINTAKSTESPVVKVINGNTKEVILKIYIVELYWWRIYYQNTKNRACQK